MIMTVNKWQCAPETFLSALQILTNLYPRHNPISYVLLLTPFNRWRMEAERLRDSPDDTELVSRGAGIRNQAVHLRDGTLSHKSHLYWEGLSKSIPETCLHACLATTESHGQSATGDAATKRENPIEIYHWVETDSFSQGRNPEKNGILFPKKGDGHKARN